jgi:hypothetical protein
MVNYNGIKRLIAFGCSFTAGCELLDHTLPPPYFALKKELPIFKWYEVISKDLESFRQLNLNREKEKYLAWPAKLSNILDLDFVSFAIGGNSNEKILWQIEKAICDNIITNEDLVVIGLTSANRSIFFNDSDNEPVPFLLADSSFIEKSFSKNFYTYFNDSKILWNYIRDLEHYLWLKKKINNNLFLVHMEVPFLINQPHKWGLTNLGKQADFFDKKIKELMLSNLFLSQSEYLYKDLAETDKFNHGHPKEYVHQQFALTLSKYFQKSANN